MSQDDQAWIEDSKTLSDMSQMWRSLVRDPLTGLFSRNALLTFADDAIPYYRRYRRTVAVLLVEIDALADVITQNGLTDESEVLRHVAEILDLSVRNTDKVARFDVRQFILLLREIDEAGTATLAGRIRHSIEDLRVRLHGRTIPLTVSIGAAVVSDSDETSAALIERAEVALAAAQTDGGNRVVVR